MNARYLDFTGSSKRGAGNERGSKKSGGPKAKEVSALHILHDGVPVISIVISEEIPAGRSQVRALRTDVMFGEQGPEGCAALSRKGRNIA
ncbi:MAG: hypothetical protein QM682_11100 [Paracoccus sp. (in: a-proteobacteria)]|uniref:hypothetical protein n=1 Tax=Paracoccus sp. TaxID=267 RepID=UPI0039E42034